MRKSVVSLVATAAGIWLILMEVWKGWPGGQLIGLNAVIAGVVLAGVGLLGLGLRWPFERGGSGLNE